MRLVKKTTRALLPLSPRKHPWSCRRRSLPDETPLHHEWWYHWLVIFSGLAGVVYVIPLQLKSFASPSLHLQLKISMAVSFNKPSVCGTSMHKRLIISIRSKCLWSCFIWSQSKAEGVSGPQHVPRTSHLHPYLLFRSRHVHRKWLSASIRQLCGFASAKAEHRDPQPAARRWSDSAGIAGTFSIYQFQSCLGCHVALCHVKNCRAASLAQITSSLVDKFLGTLVMTLKLRAEMIITASPFTTCIVGSPRSAAHLREAFNCNDDIAFTAKLPAREALPIKSHPPLPHFCWHWLELPRKNRRPVNDVSEKILCTCTPGSGVSVTSPSIDTSAAELVAASVFVWFEPPIALFSLSAELGVSLLFTTVETCWAPRGLSFALPDRFTTACVSSPGDWAVSVGSHMQQGMERFLSASTSTPFLGNRWRHSPHSKNWRWIHSRHSCRAHACFPHRWAPLVIRGWQE